MQSFMFGLISIQTFHPNSVTGAIKWIFSTFFMLKKLQTLISPLLLPRSQLFCLSNSTIIHAFSISTLCLSLHHIWKIKLFIHAKKNISMGIKHFISGGNCEIPLGHLRGSFVLLNFFRVESRGKMSRHLVYRSRNHKYDFMHNKTS
jgi:hypothetical protein